MRYIHNHILRYNLKFPFYVILGGEESDPNSPTGSRTVNRVTKYDCEHRQWNTGPSMLLARRWAGAIVVDDSIYVIGRFFSLGVDNCTL